MTLSHSAGADRLWATRSTIRGVAGAAAVLVFAIPRPAVAQSAPDPDRPARFYADINLAGAGEPLGGSREFASRFVRFAEVGSSRASYPKPARSGPFRIDVAGGLMLTRAVGIGVGYSRTTYDEAAGLHVTVPHPSFLDAAVSASGVTSRALTRREAAVRFDATLSVLRARRVDVRVFGGPALLSYSAEMVSEASFAQSVDPLAQEQTLDVTGFTAERVTARTVGFGLGADVTYFPTRHLGIGAGMRFDRGTATLEPEPLSKQRQQITIGSASAFVGLRARFGG